MLSIIMLIAGVILLVKGADLLVDGGVGIALKSGVSHLVVGLTVVAFGTSAPELTVSLTAAFQGSGDVCFGNVVGSNIANIALILGVTALIRPVSVNKNLIHWEIPFMIFISIITCYIGYTNSAGRFAGVGLLLLFVYYIVHCMKGPVYKPTIDVDKAQKKYPVLFLMVCIGVLGLGIGGKLFVDGAIEIARMLGVSEAVIALTVIALGTSLPELVTSVVAAIKGHSDIFLGNIIGSNIFNILLVIGATALLRPFSISPDRYLTLVGMPLMMVLSIMVVPFAMSNKKLKRAEGAVFSLLYGIAIALAVIMA